MTPLLALDRRQRINAQRMGCALLCLTTMLVALATPWAGSAQRVPASVPHVKVHVSTTGHPATGHHPRHNVPPRPDYLATCAADGPNDHQCLRKALQAIDNARAAEGVRKMVLPSNYLRLSIAEQTFVVTDLERVDRGLRPVKGLVRRLNARSHHAAVIRDDPTLVDAILERLAIRDYASIWAGDFGPLSSDYDWMYYDGYSASGSVNLACEHPGAAGCWGHREVILGRYSGLRTLIAGSGTSRPNGASIAEVLAGSRRSSLHFTYTWKRALAHGADAH